MKNLNLEQMVNLEGGTNQVAAVICGAGFAGYWGIIETGFWAAGIATGGIGIAVGLGVAVIGAVACSYID
ncbi:hypothetical protein [Labilibaculum euxinus]